jgi:hypothetical protein
MGRGTSHQQMPFLRKDHTFKGQSKVGSGRKISPQHLTKTKLTVLRFGSEWERENMQP